MQITHSQALTILTWCANNFGTTSGNGFDKAPTLQFITASEVIRHNSEVKKETLGMYSTENNDLFVFAYHIDLRYPYTGLYNLVDTIIHEYVHFIQNLKQYGRYSKKYGYYFNPLEVEAREVSAHYTPKCALECFPDVFTEFDSL